MKKIILVTSLTLLTILSCKQTNIKSTEASTKDKPQNRRGGGNYTKDMLASLENNPFEGIVTSQGKEENLFPIKSTGVSTEPIFKSAKAFLNSLSKEQQNQILFEVDDEEWRKWSNVDNGMYKRNGISLRDMTQQQRKLAFQLLSDALSAKGLQLTKDIMKTDQTLKELNNGDERFDEDLYYLTILGNPSTTAPWGWKFNGHHLAINYFVLGDQVVMTPTFMGGEPVITTSGKYEGNTIFQDEQNLVLKFMQSFPQEIKSKAIISSEKTRDNMQATAFSDNLIIDYEGLKASEMTEKQKTELLNLIAQYVNNIKEGHAKVKMEDVKKYINDTYFAWRGKTDENAVFYYKIHSPVILIEFDHQVPVGIRGKRKPTRNHIHTIVRTPNGNDYGKDYLKQHLEKHHR